MTEPLKTYHIKVKFLSDLRYGEFITAPTEEAAKQLFLDEYVYISSARVESTGVKVTTDMEALRAQNLELQAEISTLRAMYRGAFPSGK